MTHIDWFAVECAVTGTPMRLNAAEQRAAVRRLTDKMRPLAACAPQTGNTITLDDVAALIGCSDRQVIRLKVELPDADEQKCPVCRQQMWVWHNGVIEPHPDALNIECPASNTAPSEGDWEYQTALKVMWLARRLRAGDVTGVWNHISGLTDMARRQLLVASLAGVEETEDPFSWLANRSKEEEDNAA